MASRDRESSAPGEVQHQRRAKPDRVPPFGRHEQRLRQQADGNGKQQREERARVIGVAERRKKTFRHRRQPEQIGCPGSVLQYTEQAE